MPTVANLPFDAPEPTSSPGEEAGPFIEGKLLEDVPFEAYRAAPSINASGLKTFKRSPAHYWIERYIKPRAETPALRFGRLLHMAVLEPERLQRLMRVRPDLNLRTNAGKAELERWRTDLGPDGIEVSEAEAEQLTGMLTSVQAQPRIAKLLGSGKREATLYWTDDATKEPCKARYDFVAEGTNVIVDIKTTLDARPHPFTRDSVRFDYGLSAAHYLSGARHTGVANSETFAIVAIEKDAPYAAQLYKFTDNELERSTQWYRQSLEQFAECRRTDVWPSYPDTFEPLGCPAWAPWVVPPEG